jgi:polysaccharide pyruvyl transferase WcaK-like protein
MSEFIPPSYTGDPNMARAEEECFTLGFYAVNAAICLKCLGLSRGLIDSKPRTNMDLALAVAEEVDNKKRRARGENEVTRVERLGKKQFLWQQRWKEYYRARNSI